MTIPQLAFGCGTIWYRHKGNEAGDMNATLVECILNALRSGFRHFDTAELYGTEREFGRALLLWVQESEDNKRSDVFVAAKATYPYNLTQRFEDTMQRFGPALAGYVDLYLLHSPLWDYSSSDSEMPMATAWKDMESLVVSGRAKAIGVSNFREIDLQALLDTKPGILPACNQIQFHAYLQETELLRFCREKLPEMSISSYGVMSPYVPLADKGDLKTVVDKIALQKGAGVTGAQVLLAWGLSLGVAQITTTSKVERMVEACKSQQIVLTDVERAEITEAGAGMSLHWQHGPIAHESYKQ
ncbi:NADP-dependent oxidoreductase domain-containing protein [Chytriomyces sp. MP71]|nr:NADP-dependent oxidoreductase domain-containing protein [Chytriomyces sp. MP71]